MNLICTILTIYTCVLSTDGVMTCMCPCVLFANVAGLPPLTEGVDHVLGPQQWIKDSTLWIFVYLMMEFILKDSALKNSGQKDIA